MSSDTHLEGVEKLTLEVLLPIRDFVITYGSETSPGRDLISLSLDLDEGQPDFIIDVQTTLQCLSMRITLGNKTPPNRFRIIALKGEGNHLFLDTKIDPSDIITLSTVIQLETGLPESPETLH